MNDEELLNEALDCIYDISGAYINFKDPSYPRHKQDLDDLDRVTKLLEQRLGRNTEALIGKDGA